MWSEAGWLYDKAPNSSVITCIIYRLFDVGAMVALIHELTFTSAVGILANMSAQLITRFKDVTPEGEIIEWIVWRVPHPVIPSLHEYKYRAVFIVDGVRVVGFDNERGKGDHCHLNGREYAYEFRGVEELVEDFIAAVDAWRTS